MKTGLYGYRTDITGLLFLALALFLSLALSSYHPLDPSFNSLGTFVQAKNKCGYLGSFLADLLYQFFGLGAWLFVLLSLKRAMTAFQRKASSMGLMTGLAVTVLSLLVSSSLLELHQPDRTFFKGHIYPGGILGRALVRFSLPYLHFAGLALLFWSSALMLFVIITKSSVSELFWKSAYFLKTFSVGFSRFLWAKSGLKQGGKAGLSAFKRLWKRPEKLPPLSSFSLDLKNPLKDISFFPGERREKRVFDKKAEKTGPDQNLEGINWKLPPLDMLSAPPESAFRVNDREHQKDARRLLEKLQQFSISGRISHIRSGPLITLFEFKPEDHVKVARITQMEDDLMIALKSKSIRIIAPIPGKDVVGIETAHSKRQTVYLKRLLEDPDFLESPFPLPLVLGRHADGRFALKDLGKIPHLMVAGSTGSGKSVFIVSFLLSLLFRHSPETLRLLLVDPKQVDLSLFEGLPHLLSPPIRESRDAVLALNWCLSEMQKRYRSLSRFSVRDLAGFNEKTKHLSAEEVKAYQAEDKGPEESFYFSPQPYICIVLEEFGDLMSSPERGAVENLVVRLAQMARACGMHLVLSMQSPRKDVVTGLIKTNIPGRISFKVSSRIDSRIILDTGGAERLLAQGDMLYLGPGEARPERFHGPFVRETELLSVLRFWREQKEDSSYVIKSFTSDRKSFYKESEEEEDQKYEEIFSYVAELKEVSASHLQRKYGLGYPRAARLIDRLEEEGVVGPARGSKPREVLK